MKKTNNVTTVFISYSWDSKKHQDWVISLADAINEAGGYAVIDKKHLKYGGHIKTFMINSILNADIVLLILTPNYKKKADLLSGGAGYEYNIINDELFKIITTNEKYISVLRDGDVETSVTNFLRGFNYVDLRIGPSYENNLRELLKQIIKPSEKLIIKQMKPNEIEYKNLASLSFEIKDKAFEYFTMFFNKDSEKLTKATLKTTITDWEEEIDDYHESLLKKFNPTKMELYVKYLEDFKTKVLAKELWTIKAALRTPDPDLIRYKSDYKSANSRVIYNTINGILEASREYVDKQTDTIKYQSLKSAEDLKMKYLEAEDMSMTKIIGYGIRSEILHRYFPSSFPIMSQKSLWAMYFVCSSSNEFIVVEQKKGEKIMRVSHNWQYPYDRFAYLMNVLYLNLTDWFEIYGIKTNPKYRFGYVNLFLSIIYKKHLSDIRLLHKWEKYDV